MRVVFVGDSLTVGVGDPSYLGWVGRLCARAPMAGLGLTEYNLGVCSETSLNIKARLARELPPRLLPREAAKVVLSFGINDTRIENGRRKVSLAKSIETFLAIVRQASAMAPVLMVGPPPVLDRAHCQRIEELSALLALTGKDIGLPYLEMCRPLRWNDTYLESLRAYGDGYHPEAAGYEAIARRVAGWDAWQGWFRNIRPPVEAVRGDAVSPGVK